MFWPQTEYRQGCQRRWRRYDVIEEEKEEVEEGDTLDGPLNGDNGREEKEIAEKDESIFSDDTSGFEEGSRTSKSDLDEVAYDVNVCVENPYENTTYSSVTPGGKLNQTSGEESRSSLISEERNGKVVSDKTRFSFWKSKPRLTLPKSMNILYV